MAIEIQRSPTGDIIPGQTVTFTIVSGVSSCLYAYFEWYLDDVLIGNGNNCSVQFDTPGTFSLYENITFVNNNVPTNTITDLSSNVIQPPSTTVVTSNSGTTNASQTVSEWPKAGRTVIIYTKYKNTTI